jgi:hypothetical protein
VQGRGRKDGFAVCDHVCGRFYWQTFPKQFSGPQQSASPRHPSPDFPHVLRQNELVCPAPRTQNALDAQHPPWEKAA